MLYKTFRQLESVRWISSKGSGRGCVIKGSRGQQHAQHPPPTHPPTPPHTYTHTHTHTHTHRERERGGGEVDARVQAERGGNRGEDEERERGTKKRGWPYGTRGMRGKTQMGIGGVAYKVWKAANNAPRTEAGSKGSVMACHGVQDQAHGAQAAEGSLPRRTSQRRARPLQQPAVFQFDYRQTIDCSITVRPSIVRLLSDDRLFD
jgi:hypothetical protein